MIEGIILKGIGGFYYVKTIDGIYECKPRGIFRKDQMSPIAGDRVEIKVIDQTAKKGVIEKILDRKSFLIRPSIANIDQAFLVFAIKSPDPDLMLLDKMLIKTVSRSIKPHICINKIDITQDKNEIDLFERYYSNYFNLIFLSAKRGIGIKEVQALLQGKTSMFAGPSGVGKSTLLNRIFQEDKVKTGALSEKISRGKHTTREVELFELDENSYIADTPGFSTFDIDNIKSSELSSYYPEFEEYLGQCKFNGCSHIAEPSCAVKEAVEEGKIDTGRYERYKQIYADLKGRERKW
jgi:ribosome biogenesis GTPase